MRKLLQEIQINVTGGYVSVYVMAAGPDAWTVHTITRLRVLQDKTEPVAFARLDFAEAHAWREAQMLSATWPGAGAPFTAYPRAQFTEEKART
jgi:hypothetical protein